MHTILRVDVCLSLFLVLLWLIGEGVSENATENKTKTREEREERKKGRIKASKQERKVEGKKQWQPHSAAAATAAAAATKERVAHLDQLTLPAWKKTKTKKKKIPSFCV